MDSPNKLHWDRVPALAIGSASDMGCQLRPICRNCPELKPITNGILCQIDVIGYGVFPHSCRKQRVWSGFYAKSMSVFIADLDVAIEWLAKILFTQSR
jgi:hypothetical protein